MCKPHWRAYTNGLRKDALARKADSEGAPQGADKSAVDARPERREPATSRGRHISLPERDLESEIGAY